MFVARGGTILHSAAPPKKCRRTRPCYPVAAGLRDNARSPRGRLKKVFASRYRLQIIGYTLWHSNLPAQMPLPFLRSGDPVVRATVYHVTAAFFGHDHNYQHYLKEGIHYIAF
jgi:hypothetical protein